MDNIEQKIKDLGYQLPQAFPVPEAMQNYMTMAKIDANRCFVSGHAPLNPDGTIAEPLGKVGQDLTIEQAYHASHLTALAVLSTLKQELGSLARIKSWNRVFGMVNAVPGFHQQTQVINGFSETIGQIFSPEVARHSRSAIGVAELPFNLPVEIEVEISIFE